MGLQDQMGLEEQVGLLKGAVEEVLCDPHRMQHITGSNMCRGTIDYDRFDHCLGILLQPLVQISNMQVLALINRLYLLDQSRAPNLFDHHPF